MVQAADGGGGDGGEADACDADGRPALETWQARYMYRRPLQTDGAGKDRYVCRRFGKAQVVVWRTSSGDVGRGERYLDCEPDQRRPVLEGGANCGTGESGECETGPSLSIDRRLEAYRESLSRVRVQREAPIPAVLAAERMGVVSTGFVELELDGCWCYFPSPSFL